MRDEVYILYIVYYTFEGYPPLRSIIGVKTIYSVKIWVMSNIRGEIEMKKSYFVVGLLVTVLGLVGIVNPLGYINTLGRFIEPIMPKVIGDGGMILVLVIIALHVLFIINFWIKVARRIQEVKQ